MINVNKTLWAKPQLDLENKIAVGAKNIMRREMWSISQALRFHVYNVHESNSGTAILRTDTPPNLVQWNSPSPSFNAHEHLPKDWWTSASTLSVRTSIFTHKSCIMWDYQAGQLRSNLSSYAEWYKELLKFWPHEVITIAINWSSFSWDR